MRACYVLCSHGYNMEWDLPGRLFILYGNFICMMPSPLSLMKYWPQFPVVAMNELSHWNIYFAWQLLKGMKGAFCDVCHCCSAGESGPLHTYSMVRYSLRDLSAWWQFIDNTWTVSVYSGTILLHRRVVCVFRSFFKEFDKAAKVERYIVAGQSAWLKMTQALWLAILNVFEVNS